MYFDGACSKTRPSNGIIIVSPEFDTKLFSYRLEFECTKNIVQYEALNLGLDISLDMKIKFLKVIGESELIVSKIKRVSNTKN
jgi:ribonuclease HI